MPLRRLRCLALCRAAVDRLSLGAYRETNAGVGGTQLGLSFADRDIWSLPSFVGVQVDTRLTFAPLETTAWVRTAWRHEFADRRSIDASFQVAPGFGFVIDGVRAAADAVTVSAGTKVKVNSWGAFYLAFDGEFSDRSSLYSGSVGFKGTW
ncbi:hypothetical protein CH341_14125 [Rhodoplanes roseus]|uniref:Autotransporter domain-containing protein n=1 Tax=Rhodoplanes roseus TaxID=29409 RepID=A0A327L0R8_9BRAD|nr:hypothetical protein CH341_14125 [Rhodoplanes roseus]